MSGKDKLGRSAVQSYVWHLTSERNKYRGILMVILRDWRKIRRPSKTEQYWIDRLERVLDGGNS